VTPIQAITDSSLISDIAASRHRELGVVLSSWESGNPPDANGALKSNPSLGGDRSLLIELAYNEFRLRTKAGEDLSPASFCRRFPAIEYSLRRFLDCYSLLAGSTLANSAVDAIVWPQIGVKIDDFTILEELGRGSFSRVYLALQNSTGNRLVAIKASLGEVGEARILGRLSHPNIVPLYSVHHCGNDGIVLLCMPHRARATLADVLDVAISERGRPITSEVFVRAALRHGDDGMNADVGVRRLQQYSYVDSVLQIGLALFEALRHAHDSGILHLDVKPSNVLLAFDGTPLLVDFNLSSDERDLVRRVGGTLPYMAPEALRHLLQLPDLREPLDGRTDVFSLGVVLYQLLSLSFPFEVEQADSPIAKVADRQIRRIAAGAPSLLGKQLPIDGRTNELIRRCLSFAPADRPTAAEAIEELKACLSRPIKLRRALRAKFAAIATPVGILLAIAVFVPLCIFFVAEFGTRGRSEIEQAKIEFTAPTRSIATVPSEQSAIADDGLMQARKLMSEKQYFEAMRVFEERKTPQNSLSALAWICYCACRMDQFPQAITAGQAYRDMGGKEATVLNNLGYALRKSDRIEEARSVLTEACGNSSPPLDAALFNRGQLYMGRPRRFGSPPDPAALADFRALVDQKVKSGEPYYLLASLLIEDPVSQASQRTEIFDALRNAIRYGAKPATVMTLATSLKSITIQELQEIAGGVQEPGYKYLFDPIREPK